MTAPSLSSVLRLAVLPVLLLGLAGCAGSDGAAPSESPAPSESETPSPTPSEAETCDEVTVVVEFGSLDAPTVRDCGPAGTAADALAAAGITTEGTADYGDQVVCRVADLPSVEDESCATLPADAYWAVWIKTAADAEWEYAQEGITTQQVTAGQSLGLVYTAGTDSTPPTD